MCFWRTKLSIKIKTKKTLLGFFYLTFIYPCFLMYSISKNYKKVKKMEKKYYSMMAQMEEMGYDSDVTFEEEEKERYIPSAFGGRTRTITKKRTEKKDGRGVINEYWKFEYELDEDGDSYNYAQNNITYKGTNKANCSYNVIYNIKTRTWESSVNANLTKKMKRTLTKIRKQHKKNLNINTFNIKKFTYDEFKTYLNLRLVQIYSEEKKDDEQHI